jgi:hypothetical protein
LESGDHLPFATCVKTAQHFNSPGRGLGRHLFRGSESLLVIAAGRLHGTRGAGDYQAI